MALGSNLERSFKLPFSATNSAMTTIVDRLLFTVRLILPGLLLVLPERLIPKLGLLSRSLVFSIAITPPVWVNEWIQ